MQAHRVIHGSACLQRGLGWGSCLKSGGRAAQGRLRGTYILSLVLHRQFTCGRRPVETSTATLMGIIMSGYRHILPYRATSVQQCGHLLEPLCGVHLLPATAWTLLVWGKHVGCMYIHMYIGCKQLRDVGYLTMSRWYLQAGVGMVLACGASKTSIWQAVKTTAWQAGKRL